MWYRTLDKLPEEGEIVDTKVDDYKGCRNETQLMFKHNMWFYQMVVVRMFTILQRIGNMIGCN